MRASSPASRGTSSYTSVLWGRVCRESSWGRASSSLSRSRCELCDADRLLRPLQHQQEERSISGLQGRAGQGRAEGCVARPLDRLPAPLDVHTRTTWAAVSHKDFDRFITRVLDA